MMAIEVASEKAAEVCPDGKEYSKSLLTALKVVSATAGLSLFTMAFVEKVTIVAMPMLSVIYKDCFISVLSLLIAPVIK
jgi:hypothetical protein